MLAVLTFVGVLAVQEALAPTAPSPGTWTSWRGPGNTGSAEGCSPPLRWSPERNVRWRSAVIGTGQATPIVLADRVVLLTAVQTDEAREPFPTRPLMQDKEDDAARPAPPGFVYDFVVLCYARDDGRLLWQKTVHSEQPHEGHHRHGSYAAASALTDGTHLYAWFNSFGLYALDLDGEVLWEQDFGAMTFDRGEGASVALHDGILVIPWSHRGPSEVIAVNADSGDVRWREPMSRGANRSTPVVAEVDGRTQVILYGSTVQSHDLYTGELQWTCDTKVSGAIASPVIADGVVVFGASSTKKRFLGALELKGASGDCTESLLWKETRAVPHVPTPAYHRGVLYLLKGDDGILSAIDPRTGEVHYGPQRLDLGTVYCSPVAAEDRVYVTDRDGTTVVLRAGPGFEVLARNDLGEAVESSMALVDREIYLRGETHLFCLADEAGSQE